MEELNYAQLLSGTPYKLEKIGHIKSPLLRDIKDKIGFDTYKLYMNYILLDVRTFMSHTVKNPDLDLGDLLLYDFITYDKDLTLKYQEILNFFFVERVSYNKTTNSFDIYKRDKIVGTILRTEFDEVRRIISELNHVHTEKPINSFKSKKAKEVWEKIQREKKKLAKKDKGAENYEIGNLISKMCIKHPSYNLLNIWDLTIYQFYDQIAQLNFITSHELSEKIYAQHGGEDFKFDEWLNRISNL